MHDFWAKVNWWLVGMAIVAAGWLAYYLLAPIHRIDNPISGVVTAASLVGLGYFIREVVDWLD